MDHPWGANSSQEAKVEVVADHLVEKRPTPKLERACQCWLVRLISGGRLLRYSVPSSPLCYYIFNILHSSCSTFQITHLGTHHIILGYRQVAYST
jgi:hypothetical protein